MRMHDVLLVNERDEPQGTMEKMEAHRQGVLHRAFSVFIFDSAGRMLLQQRAAQKYHGGLLWTNTCCSHPYPDEAVSDAAQRRLQEELGFTTPLQKIFHFTYRADVENGLVEHEYDHVFAGEYEGPIKPNAAEVANYAYKDMEALKEAVKDYPSKFTSWFRLALPRVEEWWSKRYKLVSSE